MNEIDELMADRSSRMSALLGEVDAADAAVDVLTSADPIDALISYLDEHDASMVAVGDPTAVALGVGWYRGSTKRSAR